MSYGVYKYQSTSPAEEVGQSEHSAAQEDVPTLRV